MRQVHSGILGPGAWVGITFRQWGRILRRHRFAISPRYAIRSLCVTHLSLWNSLLSRMEEARFGRVIRRTAVEPPVFVIGLWRSGTTHLHYLLAQDRRFAFPNVYQVLCPSTFLLTERVGAPLLDRLLPQKRPMDRMAFGVHMPQEEEFALWVLTGLSVFLGLAFPAHASLYDRYVTLSDVPEAERDGWKAAFLWFLKKLTVKHQRPLVLKSPGHTGRIRLLLELFPDARFVHVHRNPYHVFQSALHAIRSLRRFWALEQPKDNDAAAHVLRLYRHVYDRYFAERHLVPRGHLHEVAFEDLERDPLGCIREVYHALDLPDFRVAEPGLRRYVASIADYRKNEYGQLPASLRQRIARAWHRTFDEWGYPTT